MKKKYQKSRSSWIDITFSIIIVTLTVSAIYLFSLTTKNEAATLPEKKQAAVPAKVIIDTIDSHYKGIKIITETSNNLDNPYAIQYPQSLHSGFNKDISLYIKTAKQNYLTTMEENKQLSSDIKGELNISFETLAHSSGSYSFVLVNSSATGTVAGKTEIKSFHLTPETGDRFSISDVLSYDQQSLEAVSKLVRVALNNDPSLANYLLPEEMNLKTKATWENFDNFAITDESIIFYFAEQEIATGAAGPPIVAIPISDINNYLANDFKIKVDEPEINLLTGEHEKEDSVESSTPPLPDSQSTGKDEIESKDKGLATVESDSESKRVALTFDDGPDPKVTIQILDTLDKYNAKATFFMLGSRVEYYPEIAKKVQVAGHELGNHSWNHPDLTKAEVEKARNEIARTSSIIEDVTGQKATVFRPPYGAINKTVREQTDLPVILWDIDTLDWKHRNPNLLLTHIKGQTKDGSIILMHDIHKSTAEGLDAVLAYLKSEGYAFVKISEL